MNNKQNILPVFIGRVIKNFLTKVMENPDYYYSKHHNRMKRKYRHSERTW